MYPLIETSHVLSLMLFVGTLCVVDLRLVGVAFRSVQVSQITSRVLPYTVAGFIVITVTGFLLFYAIPIRTYESIWFRIKVVVIILAGLNAWFFHKRLQKNQVAWDADAKPPLGVRLSGAASLFSWAIVIITGRMIAYNWFDCDRPQPDWVIMLAGCVLDTGVSL